MEFFAVAVLLLPLRLPMIGAQQGALLDHSQLVSVILETIEREIVVLNCWR